MANKREIRAATEAEVQEGGRDGRVMGAERRRSGQ